MNDEIGNLTRFLEDHRAIFRRKAGGLSRDQLQQTLSPSDLTLGGMVKHLAFVEDWWFGRHLLGNQAEPWARVDWAADPDWDWHSAADDDPEQLWALWEDAVARSRAAVAADPRPERVAREAPPGRAPARHPALAPRAHDRGVRAAQRPCRPDPPVHRRPGRGTR